MLFSLLLLCLMAYPNARLAQNKGRNPFAWGLLSLAAFFFAYCLFGSVYLTIVYPGPFTREAVMNWAKASPLPAFTMFLLGIGGILLVRYILERSASKRVN